MTNPIITQLKQATEGLLFLSESDAPFEIVKWKTQGKLTPAKLLQLTEHSPDESVELVSVDEFFAMATQEEDWHDEEEREIVQRFQHLVSVLKQNLSNIQVYRVGTTDIDAYILGVTPTGNWMGLSTQLVET
ncbi:MAG: nuclease A inhibitor family protein [Microcoleus sp. PH2017_10_PVI_O_A]|uniref:nuclease A inhibitor family protein n=1 Tax=unclassified Microcoleus TaxID=2642155 RepID=UPI001DC85101|nr:MULTISPECIES: nuclease A inhibitor family protein [unclassified Microcoleus]MCC3409593.1 nuclease A inhibitor family protein [Microcoleus sp. PH2017_10_PVI_O_A]MCC3463843.1 nuclease A inhibitor family protein [Microcoleus sp. PH2017_11_PCY_U_A]MCC3482194.1 nuclease A inhibitor family protein [Microcoleus sp. PH2017_12_PCY_D_A]MCC3532279.1 nuclease A inhibitor family protein [Microcoleus sp. PH2017_21_RUC_O_A]MCC3544574.1 nuclease A inhibitor family protein [Microcoleus sp. PH2017_22_RUC_O_B